MPLAKALQLRSNGFLPTLGVGGGDEGGDEGDEGDDGDDGVDGSISLSPLYPSMSNDLHVSIATNR